MRPQMPFESDRKRVGLVARTWVENYCVDGIRTSHGKKKAPNFFGAFSIFVRVIWENSWIVNPFDPSRIGIRWLQSSYPHPRTVVYQG